MTKSLTPVVVFVDIDNAPQESTDRHLRLASLLESLADERITLVFYSHRTRAEIESIRQAIGVFHPFICESGAAAFVPGRYFGTDLENARDVAGYQAIEFGAPYGDMVTAVHRIADRLGLDVVGFSDMSVEQVARECGTSLLEARLAKLREYSEPFRLLLANPVAERRMVKGIAGAGLTSTVRGPFHYVGAASGPGAAVSVLSTLYKVAGGSVLTAGIGDEPYGAEVAARVDVVLDTGEPAGAVGPDSADWLESIIESVRGVRQAQPRALVHHAR
jgi:mannosyl-3-phosphoglycerate phosphatase